VQNSCIYTARRQSNRYCPSQRLRIVDFRITELIHEKTTGEIQSYLSHKLQNMIDKNNSILILMIELQLEDL
jgi:hypothetical protein